MMTVADRVRLRREELGMSQEELAHKMGLKSRSSITRIEKSGDEISLKDVERLSEALDCSPLYLMDWSDDVHYKPNSIEPHIVKEEHPYGTNEEKALTDKDKSFIQLYSRLSDAQRDLVDNMMKAFLEKQ